MLSQCVFNLKGVKSFERKQFIIYGIPQVFVKDSQCATVCVTSVCVFIIHEQLKEKSFKFLSVYLFTESC
jgi:hypothetical protein